MSLKGNIFKHAIGPALGGITGGISSAFDDQDDDGFTDTLQGALFGLGGAGAFGAGSKLRKAKGATKKARASRKAGGTAQLAGPLGGFVGALGAGMDPFQAQAAEAQDEGWFNGMMGGLGGILKGLGGGVEPDHPWGESNLPPWLRNQNSYYGSLGEPNLDMKSMDEWYSDPGINKIANAQVIAANAATMREIESLKKRRDIELEQTGELSKEFQAHANRIQADDVANTQAITEHAAERSEAIDAETDASRAETEALLAGNDVTRAEHAARMDQQEARLNEARLSDAQLLERLGVASQDILQDLSAAELMQSKNDQVKIRTSAADAITEKNKETADRWKFDKPNLMGSLVQGAMDNELQQRTFGLNAYQIKMQRAAQMRDAQQKYFTDQQAMMGGGAGEVPYAQLMGDSGFTFKNDHDDATQNIPEYAMMSPDALPPYITHEMWEAWQPAVAALRAGMAEVE